MKNQHLFNKYFEDELADPNTIIIENIHIIAFIPATIGKCLPTFYLSNKKLRFFLSTLDTAPKIRLPLLNSFFKIF